MLEAEYTLRDRNDRYYEMTLGNQPPAFLNGEYCKFYHTLHAETFIQELNFSLSQWLQVLYKLRAPMKRSISSHKSVVVKVAELAVKKKIGFYALPSVKHTSPQLCNEPGWCYSFILGSTPPPQQGNEILQSIYGQVDVQSVLASLKGGCNAVLSILKDNGFARKVHSSNPELAESFLTELLLDRQILVYKLPYHPMTRR